MMQANTPARQTQQLEFHGKTGEYFRIWIVNVLLTILTLGIYSAWAKVRTRRYFLGSTYLMGASFDYLADPVKILKGRLLVIGLFIVLSAVSALLPFINALFTIAMLFLLPLIIIKALNFNLYNTAYRNIRFRFQGEYLPALWVYIGLAFLTALTLGMAYPYFTRERKKFIIDNSAYGVSSFQMQAGTGEFYKIYMRASLLTLLILLVIASLIGLVYLLFPQSNPQVYAVAAVPLLLLTLPFLMVIYGYIYTQTANLVINQTLLENHRFSSSLGTRKICWLYFSNTLAIIVSLGLLIPWALIRTARYRISHMAILPDGDLDDFIAAEEQRAGAFGEELEDFLDLDVGL